MTNGSMDVTARLITTLLIEIPNMLIARKPKPTAGPAGPFWPKLGRAMRTIPTKPPTSPQSVFRLSVSLRKTAAKPAAARG